MCADSREPVPCQPPPASDHGSVWGHCGLGTLGKRKLEPFSLSLCHSSPDGFVLYLQDNYLQPPGSPSQMCQAGTELAELQGEASGKFLCSGWWHKGVFSAAGGAPTALSSLAEQHKPFPLPWVSPHSYSHGRMLTWCCQNAASILTLLQERTLPALIIPPHVGQSASPPSPRPHLLAPGFVLRVLAVS